MADLIVVLDRGRVVQFGSHDELIQAAGMYAELYELQACGYQLGADRSVRSGDVNRR